MLKFKYIFLTSLPIMIFVQPSFSQSWIRINQLGYLPGSIKAAVLLSKEDLSIKTFQICDVLTDKIIYSSNKIKSYGSYGAFKSTYRLDFSDLTKEGAYYIKIDSISSKDFRIANDVYDGTADFLLRYMRQQRCGYNPVLRIHVTPLMVSLFIILH